MTFVLNQILTPREVIAKNYGADHANKIHSDEGAAKYGFGGALVPGVGVYAYLTQSVVAALGLEWLERGSMEARFVHPVYDGERVLVRGSVIEVDPIKLNLELINSAGKVCAFSSASLPDSPPAVQTEIRAEDYPVRPLPPPDQLLPATISAFAIGDVLGSLEFTLDLLGEGQTFLENVVEILLIYRGAEAVCHPAFFIAQANEIVMHNVALGPWIHTSSVTQHYGLARDGERITLRGRVIETDKKRGHEYAVWDLGLFGEAEQPIARIKHSAIIKLSEFREEEKLRNKRKKMR